MSKVYVTPGGLTSLQARVGMGVAALFLVFGLAFAAVVLSESSDSEPGLRLLMGLFFLIFVVVCGSLVVTFARLQSAKGSPRDRSLVDVEIEAPAAAAGDFEARLRKLEALRQDGLVSEAEYQAKRKQIMGEPW
jgi:hypothetical protein